MITVQPARVVADKSADAELLNDRAADIISTAPLQIPGLVVLEGLTGKGVIVGLADSGLDKGSLSDLHPDLQSETGRIPRVAMLKSYAGREIPDDPVGHGTHMAATIAGSGQASGGQYQGIAPGASLYFQALLDQENKVKIPGQLKDLFSPAYSAGVRIHVNGWGEGVNQYNAYANQIDDFVYSHSDFLPIFGAGNNGPTLSSLTNEANSKNALVVGSSQVPRPVFSPEAVDASRVADSSSRGPAAGGRIKPDLLAPGSAIISACSRIADSNFPADPSYTEMGGSSMAASVTGGAAALLDEYLKDWKGIKNPSSALIKALLINGAREPETGLTEASGFGILDLANTLLPLCEGSTIIAANPGNLIEGQTLEYSIPVSDTNRPLKATLAWIDSPVAGDKPSASLVNNLDLEVVSPNGEILKGNDFKKQGISDQCNNVEQISIDKPQMGTYVVRIRGTSLQGPVWSTHYALVYGQVMRHETVLEVDANGQVTTASGLSLDLSSYTVKGSINGKKYFSSPSEIKAGCDLYLGMNKVYAFERSWESGGIQILQQQGTLLVEMNPQVRQGGYYLDKLSSSLPGLLLLNGDAVNIDNIPAGAKIEANVSPRL
ncbi:MAG: S8 family serine peptidase, partial [Syntrophomonadaceae bacterium]